MIKILFFIDQLEGGGAEKVLRSLVNHMDQANFEITVQTVWPCDASKYLAPGIRYRSVFRSRSRIDQLRYRAEAEAGILYRLHIKDDYDIECAYLEMGPTKTIAASTNGKAKKLAWVHCDLNNHLEDPFAFREKTKNWYRTFDKIICVSKDVQDSFCQLFGNEYPTKVLQNTIDEEELTRKSKEPLPEIIRKRKLTVVSLGRLSCQKGYDRLLRIHKKLIDEGFDFDLWIAGEGEERAALEQFSDENKLGGSVRLLGFVQNPYPLLSAADFLVCSSRYEGLSTFATEGIILGKALLTTDCTGMRELLGDSEYGMIVENSEEALLQGMRRMLSSSELRENYAKNAAERAEAFSSAKTVAETERFFESLLA